MEKLTYRFGLAQVTNDTGQKCSFTDEGRYILRCAVTFFEKGFILNVPIDVSCQLLTVETARNVENVQQKKEAKSLRLTIVNAFVSMPNAKIAMKTFAHFVVYPFNF